MRFKVLLFTAILLLLTAGGMAQAANVLRHLGRHPFYKPPIASVEDLRTLIATRQAEIEEGLMKAGRPDLFAPLMEQYQEVDVRSVTYGPGQSFEWMFYKTHGKGKVKVARDLVLDGDQNVPGYEFTVTHNGQEVVFGFPLICGNLALVGEKAAPPAVVEAGNQPPRCNTVFTQNGPFCGDTLTVDASGSTDPDGSIAIAEITVIDAEGKVVMREIMEGPPFVRDIQIPKGKNRVKVRVRDNDGEVVSGLACETEITGLKRDRIVTDAAWLHQRDPANHVQARVGLRHRFTEEFSVLGMVGLAPQVHGRDGKSAAVIDLLALYNLDRLSFGAGVGGWLTDGDDDIQSEKSKFDLLADISYRVWGDPEDLNASLFVTGRAGADELDEAWKYARYGGGLRLEF